MTRREEIEAAIEEDPDDPRVYAVYGDWLQEQGDPRGELIALQQAAEHDPKLAGAAQACFDRQLDSLGSYATCEFTWRHGFVRRATLGMTTNKSAELLRALLAHPSGRFIVDLSLWPGGDGSGVVGMAIDALVEHPRPTLRTLSIVARKSSLADIARLFAHAFPRLTRLAVLAAPYGDELVEQLCKSPLLRQLRELDLASGALTDRGVAHLERHREALSQLAVLDLRLNTLTPGGCERARRLAAKVETVGQRSP